LAGGPPQVISNLIGSTATWGASDIILGGPGPDGTLWRVPAAGGQPVAATQLDAAQNERTHRYPFFLPDGQHFFYLASSGLGQTNAAFVGSLDSKDRKLLPGITSEVKYADGYVLFVREGTLMAQPFDVSRLELSGDPIPVVDSFAPESATAGPYSVTATGTLAFRAAVVRPNSQLFWFDRTGKQGAAAGPAGDINDIELSPNDRYVAYEAGIPGDIWVLDTENGVVNRITSDKLRDADPVWSPDGKNLVFRGDRNGGHLYQRAFGIVAEDIQILQSKTRDSPTSWSRDGRYLAYESANDIWALPMTGTDRTPLRITQTPFRETNSQISPDGHWIAYQYEESGGVQVYIQTFPQTGVRQQVSSAGGSFPRWSRDGKELFYVSPERMLMAVAITPAGASLNVAAAHSLFELKLQTRDETNYDISSKGSFLVNVPTSEQLPQPITVILNWANSVRK
jgi:eukaryotic-like serine/threonine-protein kinase